MTSLRLFALPALLCALVGCAGDDGASKAPEDLVLARQQFSDVRHGSYRFTWRRSCECTTESTAQMRITVVSGEITEVFNLETEQAVPAEVRSSLKTIEGVFDMIEDAYNEDAASIHVTYDPAQHFPASVSIDYDLQVADEEFSLQISNVVPLDAP